MAHLAGRKIAETSSLKNQTRANSPRSQARQAAGYRQQRFGAIMPNTHRCFVMINFALKQLSLSTMRSRTHSRAQNIFVQRWNILSPMKRLCSYASVLKAMTMIGTTRRNDFICKTNKLTIQSFAIAEVAHEKRYRE